MPVSTEHCRGLEGWSSIRFLRLQSTRLKTLEGDRSTSALNTLYIMWEQPSIVPLDSTIPTMETMKWEDEALAMSGAHYQAGGGSGHLSRYGYGGDHLAAAANSAPLMHRYYYDDDDDYDVADDGMDNAAVFQQQWRQQQHAPPTYPPVRVVGGGSATKKLIASSPIAAAATATTRGRNRRNSATTVSPGRLFVRMPGANTDGNDLSYTLGDFAITLVYTPIESDIVERARRKVDKRRTSGGATSGEATAAGRQRRNATSGGHYGQVSDRGGGGGGGASSVVYGGGAGGVLEARDEIETTPENRRRIARRKELEGRAEALLPSDHPPRRRRRRGRGRKGGLEHVPRTQLRRRGVPVEPRRLALHGSRRRRRGDGIGMDEQRGVGPLLPPRQHDHHIRGVPERRRGVLRTRG